MLKESLLAAAMSFPSWYGDLESTEDRVSRLAMIALAIDDASLAAVCGRPEDKSVREDAPSCIKLWQGDQQELAFLLLTQAFFETRLALHVHQGNCRSHLGECDSGRATSLWQLQAGGHLPEEHWAKLAGTTLESTTLAAREATRALGRGLNYCGSVEGAVSLYATGRTCNWSPAAKRVRFMKQMIASH